METGGCKNGMERGMQWGGRDIDSLICLVWSRNIDFFAWFQEWMVRGKKTTTIQMNKNMYPPLKKRLFQRAEAVF